MDSFSLSLIHISIGQKLPKGFQKSEFLLEHGFIDLIVERQNLKNKLSEIIKLHYPKKIKNTLKQVLADDVNNNVENKTFQNNLTPWEKVQISRENKRPTGLDYIEKLVENFTELHGDRYFGDDSAIVGGIGTVNNKPVTVIAQVKGHNLSLIHI